MLLRVEKKETETRYQTKQEEKEGTNEAHHRSNMKQSSGYNCLDDIAAFPTGGFRETEIFAWMWVVAFVLRHIRIWVFNLIEVT